MQVPVCTNVPNGTYLYGFFAQSEINAKSTPQNVGVEVKLEVLAAAKQTGWECKKKMRRQSRGPRCEVRNEV